MVFSCVMPGLVPGIHALAFAVIKDVDGRHKAGHDGKWNLPQRYFAATTMISTR